MKKLRKKAILACTIALIIAGVCCFSGCDFFGPNPVGSVVLYIGTWAVINFAWGVLDGVGYSAKEVGLETDTFKSISEDWNNFWDGVGEGIVNLWGDFCALF